RIHGAEEGALEELLALPAVLEGHVDLFPLELEIERDLLCSPVGEGIVEAVLDLLLDHASNAHSLADSKSERDGPDLLGTAEGRHHLRTDSETIDGELLGARGDPKGLVPVRAPFVQQPVDHCLVLDDLQVARALARARDLEERALHLLAYRPGGGIEVVSLELRVPHPHTPHRALLWHLCR